MCSSQERPEHMARSTLPEMTSFSFGQGFRTLSRRDNILETSSTRSGDVLSVRLAIPRVQVSRRCTSAGDRRQRTRLDSMATVGHHDSDGDDAPIATNVPTPQHDSEGGEEQSLRPTRDETQESTDLSPQSSEQPEVEEEEEEEEEGRRITYSAESGEHSELPLTERPSHLPQTAADTTPGDVPRATNSRDVDSGDDRENASMSSTSCTHCSGGGGEMNNSRSRSISSSSSSVDSFYIPVRRNHVVRSALSTTNASPFVTSPTFMIASSANRPAQPVRRWMQVRPPGDGAPRSQQVRRSRSSPPWSGRNRLRPRRRTNSLHPDRRDGNGCECRNRSECLGDVPPCYHCAYLDVPPSYSRKHRAILDSLVSKLKSARHKEPNAHDPPRYESPFAPPSYSLSQQQQLQQSGVSPNLSEMEGGHNSGIPLHPVLAQRLVSSSSYIPIAIPFVQEDSLTFGQPNGPGSRAPGGAGGSVGVLLSCRSSPFPTGGRGASSTPPTPTPPPYSVMDIHSIGHAPWLSRRGCGHCLGYGVTTTTGGPEDNAEDEGECHQCSRAHCLTVLREVYTSACSRTLWYKLLYALPLAVVLSVCVLGFEEQPLALITYTVIFAFVVFFPLLSLVEVLTQCTVISCNVDR